MERRTSKLLTVAIGTLLTLSCILAAPAFAQGNEIYGPTPEPAWATVSATAGGNYPGGNEVFNVFVIDSALPPEGNMTVINMTLTAPALPAGANSNFGIGLPTVLAPGDGLLSTIALPIPSNFAANNFTASLVINVSLWNGTQNIALKLTGTAPVPVLAYPGTSGHGATTTVTTTASAAGVSSTTFDAGVAVPSIIAVILLVLVVRGRSKPAT